MGIGTGLLEQCMAYCRSKGGSEVTVNAISTGIPFYISSGFEVLGEERVEQGLRYIPMILKFKGR
jgi:predicted GNAT family N-acyltransferase